MEGTSGFWCVSGGGVLLASGLGEALQTGDSHSDILCEDIGVAAQFAFKSKRREDEKLGIGWEGGGETVQVHTRAFSWGDEVQRRPLGLMQ